MGDLPSFSAPFVWFGGKSMIADTVWQYLGPDVPNYCEPFFGSGACLLARPGWTEDATWTETVNDKDGFVANFWRALIADPDCVADHADWPVNENDLHARHVWLRERADDLVPLLEGDPEFYDPKVAGWWVWGLSVWIGGEFCGESGSGPWCVEVGEDGVRRLVRLGSAGQGVTRKLVHLGDAGKGVTRRRVHQAVGGDPGTGACGLYAWMEALAARLKRARVCCGDWSRICGPTPTIAQGTTGVFLDPPYSTEAGRNMNIYREESGSVAHEVRAWAIEQGRDPRMRIVLCGYEGEHNAEMIEAGWRCEAWKSHGGYASQGTGPGANNATRERLWISPHCLRPARQGEMFA